MRDDFDAEDLPRPWNWLAEGVGALVLVAIMLGVAVAVQPLSGTLPAFLDWLSGR